MRPIPIGLEINVGISKSIPKLDIPTVQSRPCGKSQINSFSSLLMLKVDFSIDKLINPFIACFRIWRELDSDWLLEWASGLSRCFSGDDPDADSCCLNSVKVLIKHGSIIIMNRLIFPITIGCACEVPSRDNGICDLTFINSGSETKLVTGPDSALILSMNTLFIKQLVSMKFSKTSEIFIESIQNDICSSFKFNKIDFDWP